MSQNFRYSVWVSGANTAGVQLYVCTQGYNTNLLPPTPLVSLFSDLAGTTPITQPMAIGASGQFTFCVPAGTYNLAIVQSGTLKVVAYDQKIGQCAGLSINSLDGTLQITGGDGATGVGTASFSDIVGQASPSQIPGGTNGSSANTVQATVDFGTLTPQETTAQAVVAALWVTASSVLLPAVVEGQDHTADEIAAEQVTVSVGTVQPGVGFTVTVSAPNGASGKFLVNIVGF